MKSDEERVLLLDTHIWVWYVEGDARRIPRRILAAVEPAVARDGVLVSAISVWEVALLDAARRIELATEVRTWVGQALSRPGIRLQALTPSIAIESTRLPGKLHRDPADRLLIATCRILGATLVTRDEPILTYAEGGYVRVLDARP
jgi:PIN domain nuclease of toxin-antitoxin system